MKRALNFSLKFSLNFRLKVGKISPLTSLVFSFRHIQLHTNIRQMSRKLRSTYLNKSLFHANFLTSYTPWIGRTWCPWIKRIDNLYNIANLIVIIVWCNNTNKIAWRDYCFKPHEISDNKHWNSMKCNEFYKNC